MSQSQKILEYLKTGGSLTPIEALRMFGCMRLGARILDIKKTGIEIADSWEVHRNESGEYKRYKRYRLAA